MLHLIKYSLIIILIFAAIHAFASHEKDEITQCKIDKIQEIINSQNNHTSDSLCILNLNLGSLYANQMKYDSAYKYYDRSLRIANETSNKQHLSIINNIIGGFYYCCENYEEALKYYKQGYNLCVETNDSLGISSLANNLGLIEHALGAHDKALDFYYAALHINKRLQHYSNLSFNHNNIGLTYSQLNNFDSALYNLKLAEKIAVNNGLNINLNNIFNSLGTYYLKVRNFDSSYFYLSKAYNQAIDLNLLFQIKENSKALSQLFEQIGVIDSAYFYYKNFKTYNDSILRNKNLMKMGLLMITNNLENERRIEKISQSRKELFYFIVFISIFSVLIILLLLWINQRNKTRHSQLKMEHLALEKKYLNNELTNFALHISENNQLIEEIKQTLKQIDGNRVSKKSINELKLKLNTGFSKSQSKVLLEQKVNEQHHEFIRILKSQNQSLTKSELKLCSLLKLNLSTKDIAGINNVTPQAVKVARYRLRKKLKLDSNINISDYLNTLKQD